MNLLKIKQTVALALLCVYFSVKTFSLFGFHVISSPQSAKLTHDQQYMYLLDAGHGYYGDVCGNKAVMEDDGRCFYEWIYNWEIRRYLATMLDSAGIQYRFINTSLKTDLPIKKRSKLANRIKSNLPKVYISIHGNASNMEKKGWEKVHGFEVYSPEKKYIIKGAYDNKKEFSDSIATWMAQEIQKQFPEHDLRTDGGNLFREAPFEVITQTKCYSILTENEFFTNPEMRKKMRTDEFKKRVARAHYNLILRLEKKS
jgi:N-acetylmuramoyl-L-alanine amidase